MEGLVSQKEKFVTLLLVDMNELTSVPIFQNLIRKQKKQKIVPKVKMLDNFFDACLIKLEKLLIQTFS